MGGALGGEEEVEDDKNGDCKRDRDYKNER